MVSKRPRAVKVVLVSACLLGTPCRYNGKSCKDQTLLKRISERVVVFLCPEQLGGLPTPRRPARIVAGDGIDVLSGKAKVLDSDGLDVTEKFLCGAKLTCEVAKLLGVKEAFLKTGSPSCGWTDTGRAADRSSVKGVTAALLAHHGIKVIPMRGGR